MLKAKSSFDDGIVKIYEIANTAQAGDMPVDGLVLKQTLRYKERTVGFNRFYVALQNEVTVDFLIRCPQLRDIKPNNIAILIDGDQYRIKQVQYPEDIEPPVMDMTLERLGDFYDIS